MAFELDPLLDEPPLVVPDPLLDEPPLEVDALLELGPLFECDPPETARVMVVPPLELLVPPTTLESGALVAFSIAVTTPIARRNTATATAMPAFHPRCRPWS